MCIFIKFLRTLEYIYVDQTAKPLENTAVFYLFFEAVVVDNIQTVYLGHVNVMDAAAAAAVVVVGGLGVGL